jgi:hypothetical protein
MDAGTPSRLVSIDDVNSASISVTDHIQVDAAGQILAGTCHWHQKWRAFDPGAAWTRLTFARSWAPGSPNRLDQMDDHAMQQAALYSITSIGAGEQTRASRDNQS